MVAQPGTLDSIAQPFHAVPVASVRRADNLIVDLEADVPALGVGERHAAEGAMIAPRERNDDGVARHIRPVTRARIERAAEERNRCTPAWRRSQDVVRLLTNRCSKERGR